MCGEKWWYVTPLWQFIIVKMVDFWCCLSVLMMGLKVFAKVARSIFDSNGRFTKISKLKVGLQ